MVVVADGEILDGSGTHFDVYDQLAHLSGVVSDQQARFVGCARDVGVQDRDGAGDQRIVLTASFELGVVLPRNRQAPRYGGEGAVQTSIDGTAAGPIDDPAQKLYLWGERHDGVGDHGG
ncbi:MAG TPA: hypothetical protein DIU15_02965 [Deltaproteobacteria bacterium]|nr:hypothetical protein [Deltaproteobacteria bacterium]